MSSFIMRALNLPRTMSWTEKVIFIIALVLLAVAAYMQIYAGFAGDKEWLLFAARKWLEGGVLYVDIIEVNPPLIIWLYAIPVWISGHVPGLADYQALALCGLCVSCVSVRVGLRLIRLHPVFAENKHGRIGFALLLAYVFIGFSSPMYFFDREHIMFVLIFPYILRFMPGLQREGIPLRMRIVIGALAAIGFCIKPHTLIIFTILQLLLLFRKRTFSILFSLENCIIYSIALLYFFCIWHFTPEYIRTVFPMALATYSGYVRGKSGIFYMALAVTSAGITFVDFRARHKTPYREDIYYFIGVCCAFLAYAQANNGWGYTYNPLLCTLLFLNGWVLWDFIWLKREYAAQGKNVRAFTFGIRDCMLNFMVNAGCIIFVCAKVFTITPCDPVLGCKEEQPFVRSLLKYNIRSFNSISLDFGRWLSLSRLSGASWDTRFNCVWMLPGLMENKELSKKDEAILKYVGRAFADDMAHYKPEMLFVDKLRHPFKGSPQMDYAAFLSIVPEFKEAWSHYRHEYTIDQCSPATLPDEISCQFDVYRRIP